MCVRKWQFFLFIGRTEGTRASPRRLGGICAKGVMVQQAQQEREFRLVFYLNQV